MHKYFEQVVKLIKTCVHIFLIYMKLAWHYLIKLKKIMIPKLQQAGRVILEFSRFTWDVSKKANSKLFTLCLQYSKLFEKFALKISHNTAVFIRLIAHHLNQYAIKTWKLVTTATRRFIQLCKISFKSFRLARYRFARQIFQFLVFLVNRVGKYSRAGWKLVKTITRRFVQLCVISFIAFRHAGIKFTRQIFQFLVFLNQLIQSLARTAWQFSIRSLNRFLILCNISMLAFRRAVLRSGRQLKKSTYNFLRLLRKLSLYIWHTIRNVSNWFSRFTVALAQNVSILFNKIIYALIWTVLKLFSVFVLTVRYVWKQWLIAWGKLSNYAKLVRLDKPIGIFLLLWPTLWALWIAADGSPDLIILLIFIAGVILMRSAGCAINDFIDRNIDSHVSRTRERPLVNGIVTPREALDVAILLILGAFILVLFLNPLTMMLSVVAVCLVVIYPFMKRITYLPQFFLGLAFAWSIPMAFAAQTNTVPEIAWLLLCATVLWAVAYDTMYAMVDREDDISIGVRSTAILFDDADRFIIGCIQVMVLVALVMIGQRLEMSQYYYAGLALAGMFSIYQQFLIKDRIPENCLKAFLNNNWFGATVFAGIYFHYQYY